MFIRENYSESQGQFNFFYPHDIKRPHFHNKIFKYFAYQDASCALSYKLSPAHQEWFICLFISQSYNSQKNSHIERWLNLIFESMREFVKYSGLIQNNFKDILL